MDLDYPKQIYSSFFICNNEEILILIIPFIMTAIISENFFIKLGIDTALIIFSILNLFSNTYLLNGQAFLTNDLNTTNNMDDILPLNNKFGILNQTEDGPSNLEYGIKSNIAKEYIFHYDLIMIIIFAFLHLLQTFKIRKKFNKMLRFITEKSSKNAKENFSSEKTEAQEKCSIGLYLHQIVDINNYLINKQIQESLLDKIYKKYFSHNFTSVEFSCLFSFARIKALDGNFIIREGEEFRNLYFIYELSFNSHLEIITAGFSNHKIYSNCWVGLEYLIEEYFDRKSKKWLNNVEYIKHSRSLSSKLLQSNNFVNEKLINSKNSNFKYEKECKQHKNANLDKNDIHTHRKSYFKSVKNIADLGQQFNNNTSDHGDLNIDYIIEWNKNVNLLIINFI